ncbi:hypothetical protein COL154_013486 [Colletotrichum chrysophilum]|uniref:uncharacterized protein n=1 Tax=Colletotrichum chrysophilum TaxID=1836956 RepID=UPI0023005B92|nr:uncharacterized protein COL26b_014256 [Colletotrichum chrysophilum]KAJ0349739.1 hypothetical protein COL154_013486 [Colletotrichum chrysophilum]KAJ0359777.1 hypothetical protein COL26b_014256 [Colletotrichum chrysophilum]
MDNSSEADISLAPNIKDAIVGFERGVTLEPEDESEHGIWAANIVSSLESLERDVEASIDLSDLRASLSHATQQVVIRALDVDHDPATLHTRSPNKLEKCCLTWKVTPGTIAFWFRLDHGRPFFDALAAFANTHPRWLDALRLVRRCSTDRRGASLMQARDRGITTQDLNKAAGMNALPPELPKQPVIQTRDTMVSLALGEDLGANGIGACVDALLTLNKVKPTFHIFDPREPFERYAEQEVTACLPDNLVVLLRLESRSSWIVVHLKRSVPQVDVCDTAEPATELDVIKAWIEPWIKARQLVDLEQPITYTSLPRTEQRIKTSSGILALALATFICTEQSDLAQFDVEVTQRDLQKILSGDFAQQLGLQDGIPNQAQKESDLAIGNPSSQNAVARLVGAACPGLRPLLNTVQSTLKHKSEVVGDALKQINEDIVRNLGCSPTELSVKINALETIITRELAEDTTLLLKQRAADSDVAFFEGIVDKTSAVTEHTSAERQKWIAETEKSLVNAKALQESLKVEIEGRRGDFRRNKVLLETGWAYHTLVADLNATQVYTKQALDSISALV